MSTRFVACCGPLASNELWCKNPILYELMCLAITSYLFSCCKFNRWRLSIIAKNLYTFSLFIPLSHNTRTNPIHQITAFDKCTTFIKAVPTYQLDKAWWVLDARNFRRHFSYRSYYQVLLYTIVFSWQCKRPVYYKSNNNTSCTLTYESLGYETLLSKSRDLKFILTRIGRGFAGNRHESSRLCLYVSWI